MIGEGAVVEGSVERCVVWPGAYVGPREHLVEVVRAGLARAKAQGKRLGRQARAYTSAATADDFEAVRAHLGIPKLDLYGVSYGPT